jgi:hypothetical protein
MKTRLIASLVVAGAALGGAPTSATAQSAGTDSVTGDASDCLEFYEPVPGVINCRRRLSLSVEVESGPAGENPDGTLTWNDLGITPGGSTGSQTEATCLSASGRVAIIGVTGSLRRGGSGGAFPIPIAGLVRVVDAGGPDSGADTFQFAIQTGPEDGPPLPGPTSCSTFPGTFPTGSSLFPDFTNETRDVTVTDTRALPSSKEECKNGGWRSFGVFANQGDCVSFVATGGKNPPAGP